MNIGQLREAINGLPDNMELVGDNAGGQQDIWQIGLAKRGDDGLYEIIEQPEPEGDINFLIAMG